MFKVKAEAGLANALLRAPEFHEIDRAAEHRFERDDSLEVTPLGDAVDEEVHVTVGPQHAGEEGAEDAYGRRSELGAKEPSRCRQLGREVARRL